MTVTTTRVDALRALDPAAYTRHPWHHGDRAWAETNCYVDLWIELLHAIGCDPAALGAFTLGGDFVGDQWEFFKPPAEDLYRLYGIDVRELNVWRPILEHVVDQGKRGRLLTVEVDAHYLPDTAGLTYHLGHEKTTITPVSVDAAARRMTYFHNAGFFELGGDDFDRVLRQGEEPGTGHLGPYVELIRFEQLEILSRTDLRDRTRELVVAHLGRRPLDNPVVALGRRVVADLEWLTTLGDDATFHAYAFGMCRQCGASAQIAASFLRWLGHDGAAADRFDALARDAKSLQFTLARAARGRSVDPRELLARMAQGYDDAIGELVSYYLP